MTGLACRQRIRLLQPTCRLCIVLSLFVWQAPVDGFSGGKGEPHDPYQIATRQDLLSINLDPALLQKHFRLIADIDLDPNLPGGLVFNNSPIAGSFSGTFDGSGHKISNMEVRALSADEVGLFARLMSTAMVKDLVLEDVRVTGGNLVGAVCGSNHGQIEGCQVRGLVTGQSSVGGLVGGNNAFIERSLADTEVAGTTNVGGLVGYNNGTIRFSLSRGTVEGTSSVGGLIGYNQTLGTVTSCYSQAAVKAVRDCGGLIGFNGNDAVFFCYASGAVQAEILGGGLVGRGKQVYWCFWDIDSTGQSSSAGGMGCSKTRMQQAETFAGWGIYGEWVMTKGPGYPCLTWEGRQGEPMDPNGHYSGGSGTGDDPYRIATVEDLAAVGWHPSDFGKHFVLCADLEAELFDPDRVLPIGIRTMPFTGVFDGNDKQILGYQIVKPGLDYVGLFGQIAQTGKVQRVRLVRTTAIGSQYVGALAGYNSGLVEGCSAEEALVSGNDGVGGLIGCNYAIVKNGRCTGVVRGKRGVGGLAGFGGGIITDCHCVVDVNGMEAVGGLVGSYGWAYWAMRSSETIERCHSSGNVQGNSCVGGLVGRCQDISGLHIEPADSSSSGEAAYWPTFKRLVQYSYSDTQVKGVSEIGGLVGSLLNGEVFSCYSRGLVTGQRLVGGLVGRADGGITNSYFAGSISIVDPDPALLPAGSDLSLIRNVGAVAGRGYVFRACVWDKDLAGVPRGLGSMPQDPATILGWTTSQMTDGSGYLKLGWGSSLPVWTLVQGLDYPHLAWEGREGKVLCDELTGFCRGKGTPEDPFLIWNPRQLASLSQASEMWDRHFALANDIDMDPNLPDGCVFASAIIGRSYLWAIGPFTGSFDGRGHTIKDLKVNAPNADHVGLFGQIADGASVHDLALEKATIIGRQRVGGLAGSNQGIISRCYVDGTICGQQQVGGLVGVNSLLVEYCYATGTVLGQDLVGGMIGKADTGIVRSSYALATVQGTGTWIGGLVGGGNYCFRHCYFLDQVDGGGPDNKNGIPLRLQDMHSRDCFVGWDFWGTDIDGKEDVWYMPKDSHPILVYQARTWGLESLPQVKGLTLSDVLDVIGRKGFFVRKISYDYSDAIPMGSVISVYPRYTFIGSGVDLLLSAGRYNWAINKGDGTFGNPYVIMTVGQLESLGYHTELYDRCFVLGQDLDLGGRTYQKALIAADLEDAGNASTAFRGHAFNGTFDGAGHRISGLRILGGDLGYIGLFGAIGSSGLIKDLRVEEACVIANKGPSGVLGGSNGGLIKGCAVSGVMIGRGGLIIVGYSPGRVEGNTTDVAASMRSR